MQNFYLAALLILSTGPAARGAEPDDRQPLRLTAEVVGSRHCAGGGLDLLQLSVRLRYRNVGSRRLIVYRGKNLFYLTRIRGGAGGPPAKRYEVVVTNSRFNDAEAESLDARRPGGAFVTLRPGGTLETDIVVGVGVTRGGAERVANTIGPGGHTLQIVTSSWYESRRLAEQLRERWRDSGLLWVDPVATEPLAFDAAPAAAPAPCR